MRPDDAPYGRVRRDRKELAKALENSGFSTGRQADNMPTLHSTFSQIPILTMVSAVAHGQRPALQLKVYALGQNYMSHRCT